MLTSVGVGLLGSMEKEEQENDDGQIRPKHVVILFIPV